MSRYTEKQIDDAIALYERGVKSAEIAERTGIPRAALYYHMQQRGLVPQRRPSANKGPRSKPKTPADWQYIVARTEQLAAENALLRQALAAHGIDDPTTTDT